MQSSDYQSLADELNLGSLKEIQVIQTLWSGYGELLRLKFDGKSIIVKYVKLPKKLNHPRGWNSRFSHERKVKSYKIEVKWYENFARKIDKRCETPKVIKTSFSDDEFLIIMEDLKELGFTKVVKEANKNHLKSVLNWLANFHAKYMNLKTDLLWEEGTYWHLNTRPEELEVLKDEVLKKYAKKLDVILKTSKYQTLVHGDAKLANFCFNEEGTSCAAVDFQYVGHGCAMKDLVYFISSAINPKQCVENESWILEFYFKSLGEALHYYHPNIDAKLVESEYRSMFYIAWADFQRFIKGWSPKHYKINEYTNSMTLKAIEQIKQKEEADV